MTMSSSLEGGGETTSKKRKVPDAAAAASYEPEPIQPEWLDLPPELANIDFQTDDIAWNKYVPYSSKPAPLVPVDTPPIFLKESPALCFQIHAICGRARAGTLHFPNTAPPVPTPRFMPVGTKGTLKGVLPQEIEDCKCPMILANTYHLAIQPGTELIDSVFDGLPNFMGGVVEDATNSNNKKRRLYSMLTDSGGFQMVSLASLSQVTEDGVVFESPYTGEAMKLRPEDSIKCQNQIGADIIMQLDDVVSSVKTDTERFQLATLRTHRWYDRCVQAHKNPET
jgi:queuine tRNA-ribosyltransferase